MSKVKHNVSLDILKWSVFTMNCKDAMHYKWFLRVTEASFNYHGPVLLRKYSSVF